MSRVFNPEGLTEKRGKLQWTGNFILIKEKDKSSKTGMMNRNFLEVLCDCGHVYPYKAENFKLSKGRHCPQCKPESKGTFTRSYSSKLNWEQSDRPILEQCKLARELTSHWPLRGHPPLYRSA